MNETFLNPRQANFKSKDILISFLVPTLGQRMFELSRLLQSLENQKDYNFEVIVVAQGEYEAINMLCEKYILKFFVKVISDNGIGLSRARNIGLRYCSGEVIVLSDDDCWYPNDAVKNIINQFDSEQCDILLTQIYDFEHCELYKTYKNEQKKIHISTELLSKSSIEIAFRRKFIPLKFDEQFGIGAKYVCCEEVDFLLRALKKGANIYYLPIITVYHERKMNPSTPRQIQAKAALYAKDLNILYLFTVCIRDLLFRRQNTFRNMVQGFLDYKRTNSN